MEDFFDGFDWKNDLHKIILGVAVFAFGRWVYDRMVAPSKTLPGSDSQLFNAHIPLRQSGKSSFYETLDYMAQMVRRDRASQYLRRFALDLVRECRGHDTECEVKRLFQFVRDNITFRRDPAGLEQISDGRRTLESGVGDCDDKSILLCSLLACVGYKSRFVVCGFKPHSFSHVYLEVHTRRGWLPLDPTPENAAYGWEQRNAPYRETFNIF